MFQPLNNFLYSYINSFYYYCCSGKQSLLHKIYLVYCTCCSLLSEQPVLSSKHILIRMVFYISFLITFPICTISLFSKALHILSPPLSFILRFSAKYSEVQTKQGVHSSQLYLNIQYASRSITLLSFCQVIFQIYFMMILYSGLLYMNMSLSENS